MEYPLPLIPSAIATAHSEPCEIVESEFLCKKKKCCKKFEKGKNPCKKCPKYAD